MGEYTAEIQSDGEGLFKMIANVNIFPILLILLNAGACIVSIYAGDWRMALYWGAASVLNAAVTF